MRAADDLGASIGKNNSDSVSCVEVFFSFFFFFFLANLTDLLLIENLRVSIDNIKILCVIKSILVYEAGD